MRLVRFIGALVAGFAVVAALAGASPALAAPGALDPSFGGGGVVKLFPSPESIAGRATAVQPDGKIVVAGEDEESMLVARLLPGGGLDPSFGQGGVVRTPFPGGFADAQAVALQPDGKIVVAGEAGTSKGEFLFARYDATGALDSNFGGGDGIETVAIGALQDRANAVAIGLGGRIVAAGEVELPGSKRALGVVVLQSNGMPDPGFAGDGSVRLKTNSGEQDQGAAVAALPDGKFLVADSTGSGAGDGFTMVRLTAAGAPDPGFGSAGVVETPIPAEGTAEGHGRVTDLVLLPDESFVACGYGFDFVGSPAEYVSKFVAVKYLPGGELDPGFGDGGIFSLRRGKGDFTERIELAAGGRLLLAGSYDVAEGNGALAALRLTPTGQLDPGFGTGGLVLRGETAPFGDYIEDAALDSEERLLILSRAYTGGGNTEVVLTRLLGDREPPRPAPPAAGPPAPAPRPAHARIKKLPKKIAADSLTGFRGTAVDGGDGIAKVQIALTKVISAKAATAGAPSCLRLKDAKAHFKPAKPKKGAKGCPQLWLNASGTAKWSFALKAELPPGRYLVYARGVAAGGIAESNFSAAAGNRYAFRVTAGPAPGR